MNRFLLFYQISLTPTEGCPIPIEFAMIVDTSGSIGRRNFQRLLEFIEDMLDGFDISDKGTHIAVIEYSTNASVQLRFSDFSGAQMNAANLKRKIRKIPHARGYTYIDKALKLADAEVFSAKGGMRPDVPKVSKSHLTGENVKAWRDSHERLTIPATSMLTFLSWLPLQLLSNSLLSARCSNEF